MIKLTMSSVIRHLTMNNGLHMPSVGLGTFLMQGDTLKEAVDYALFLGYRHIDTALNYCNEIDVGQVVNDRIRAGKLKRSELFITTKVPPVYLGKESVFKSVDMSLDNLKMKYVDMLLIHQPWGNVNRGDGTLKPLNAKGERELYWYNLLETWSSFEHTLQQNQTRSIGLSNFNPRQIQRIWDNAVVKPSNLQLEVHAYWQQNVLVNFCKEKNIVVTAYCPLGGPANMNEQKTDKVLLEDPLIKEIAKEYRKTPAQILLNFQLQRNIGVLPKSENFKRIKENFDVLNWKLRVRDCEKILGLDNIVKYLTFEWAHSHPEFEKGQPF